MTKLTFNRVSSLINAPTTINGIITQIESAFDRVLFRDGTTPNQMTANLDMNNKRIYNLQMPQSDTEPARLQDINGLVDYVGLQNAKNTAVAAAAAASTSETNSAASAAASAASAAAAAATFASLDFKVIASGSATASTTPGVFTNFYLKENGTGTKKGGGLLIYDSASSATVNNGTVFSTATIGRFIRPVDGILHTNWFGIVDSAVTDQSAKFQDFINEAIANRYTAYIDPGYINCNGAQIYLNTTWAGNTARPGGGSGGTAAGGPLAGFRLTGANRRYTQIGKALIHVGAIGAYGADGLASGAISLEEFHMDKGGICLWSTEAATMLKNIRIMVGPTCSTPFNVPSTGTPGTIANTGYTTNAGIFAYGTNQLNLLGTRVECPTTETSLNYIGALFDANTNTCWNGGGVNLCGKGVVVKQTGLEFSQVAQNFVMRDCHFESNIQETLFVEDIRGCRIQGHFRGSDTVSNGNWDRANYPLLRFGNASSSKVAYGVTVHDSYFVGKSDLNATAINFEYVQEGSIFDNAIITFVNGVNLSSNATLIYPVIRNNFVSVTNDVVRDPISTYSLAPEAERVPYTLADVSNITWRVNSAPKAKLTLATASARTINAPIGAAEGLEYTIVINKSNASGSVNWNAAYVWPSATAPNITAMSTSQTCVCRFYYNGTSMLGSYTIYG